MTTVTWPVFSNTHPLVSLCDVTAFQLLQHKNRLKQDGYTIFRGLVSVDTLDTLNQAIDCLNQANLQPVGIITHPIYWAVVAEMDNIVASILGEAYVMLPETWAWDVPPSKHHKGWAPHREKVFSTLRSDGMPNSVSLWFPITAATPENSCLYVLPACDDPHYPIGPSSFQVPLQNVRAIPADPGDVIIFNHNVLHWGSQSSQWANAGRRSMAYECQVASTPAYNTPVFPATSMPPLETCRALYEQLIQQYAHFNY